MEETKPEEPKPEPTPEEPASIIDRADAVAKRIEEANKKTEELIGRQEAVAAKMMLAGRAEAGSASPKPVELTPQEYAEKVKKGEINPLA